MSTTEIIFHIFSAIAVTQQRRARFHFPNSKRRNARRLLE